MNTLSAPAIEEQTVGMHYRVRSVDILRGAVMVLMAIDHVRVYSGLPAGGPEAGIFFTRWVTHFCAPAFAFFAGTSAFLYGAKANRTSAVAMFLITRGLLLVVLELAVIRFLWAFNVNYNEFILAGVIWMLGWCMVMLAPMAWLRPRVVGIIGVAIILFQQAFAQVPGLLPESIRASFGKFWEIFYSSGNETYAGFSILYVLIPWIGVMAAGYGFGTILTLPAKKRNQTCYALGLSMIAIFIVTGSIIVLNSENDASMPFIFQLLNQRKYPASQLYLLMTIGPMILLVPYAEKMKGWIASALEIFGKVAFFYYLMHIIVIHVSALVVHLVSDGTMHHDWFFYAPYASVPPESQWSLGLLYAVFAIDVVVLYFICRWYAGYKAANPEKKWLKYL